MRPLAERIARRLVVKNSTVWLYPAPAVRSLAKELKGQLFQFRGKNQANSDECGGGALREGGKDEFRQRESDPSAEFEAASGEKQTNIESKTHLKTKERQNTKQVRGKEGDSFLNSVMVGLKGTLEERLWQSAH